MPEFVIRDWQLVENSILPNTNGVASCSPVRECLPKTTAGGRCLEALPASQSFPGVGAALTGEETPAKGKPGQSSTLNYIQRSCR